MARRKKVKKVEEVEEVLVDEETGEVIDFTDVENVTMEQLKKSPTVLKLLQTISESKKFTVKTTLIKEMNSMRVVHRYDKEGDSIHRLLTNINTTSELQALASLFEEVQAYRDRITTINIKYTVMKRDLMFYQKLCESFLYQFPIISKLKTEAQRQSKISEVLEPLTKKIIDVKNILSTCEFTTSNLANTFFTLKAVKDVAFVVIHSNEKYNKDL